MGLTLHTAEGSNSILTGWMTVQFCQAEGSSLSQIERKLAAIFAADVEGYSRLMGIDEVGTLRALTAYREIMDGLIAQHRGRIFNTAGDSVLAEFPSVVDAVQHAGHIAGGGGIPPGGVCS